MTKKEDQSPDAPMTELEAQIVAKLSDGDLDAIDTILFENIGKTWMKSAFLIGGVMLKVPDEYEELPDVFYSSRLMVMEKEGDISVRGDLGKMKHSEVQRAK